MVKAGGRWVYKHPGRALRIGGSRVFGGWIGWAFESRTHEVSRESICRTMPWFSECVAPLPPSQRTPVPPGHPRPSQGDGKSYLVKTGHGAGAGAGNGPCIFRCRGGGGGGGTGVGAGPCVSHCHNEGPPPPLDWDDLLGKALGTKVDHPVTGRETDDEVSEFVDDSFIRAQKDLELSEKELLRYFKNFPRLDDQNGLSEEFRNFLAAWNNQPSNCMMGEGKSWVYYHPLDRGRATGVTACLSADAVDYRGRGKKADPNKDTDIMGGDTTRGRGTDRSNPAGWQYLDGQRDWARGHLLGRQLGGNGRDRRNLVKLYNKANSVIMEDYESIVRGRLDAGERVFYASIPMYEGSNPVPDTVELYALGSRGSFSHWTVYNTPDGLPPNQDVAGRVLSICMRGVGVRQR